MAIKRPLEVEAGSAHDRGYESVTFIFVFLGGSLRNTTPRQESVRWCRGEGFTQIRKQQEMVCTLNFNIFK
jgi:hypothetical protein